MSATLLEALPRSMGLNLPPAVHLRLQQHGVACNQAVVMVNQAFALVVQTTNAREERTAPPGDAVSSPSAPLNVAQQLESAAEDFYAKTLIVLARAATTYAGYATQVAVALLNALPIPEAMAIDIRPSDLLTDMTRHLPLLHFPATQSASVSTDEQNERIAEAHRSLLRVISTELYSENTSVYDGSGPAVPVIGDPLSVSATFPHAVHEYAASVTWALGVFTGLRDDGE